MSEKLIGRIDNLLRYLANGGWSDGKDLSTVHEIEDCFLTCKAALSSEERVCEWELLNGFIVVAACGYRQANAMYGGPKYCANCGGKVRVMEGE